MKVKYNTLYVTLRTKANVMRRERLLTTLILWKVRRGRGEEEITLRICSTFKSKDIKDKKRI